MGLRPRDYAYIRDTGRDIGRVFAQFDLLERGRLPVRLLRPCRIDGGIRRLEHELLPSLGLRHRQAAVAGRVMSFVPASGAATRMFAGLEQVDTDDLGDLAARPGGAALAAVLRDARHLALWPDLGLPETAPPSEIARRILRKFADRPKALVPFHRSRIGVHTALEEHLREAAALTQDAYGQVRLHFTVGVEHLSAFQSAVAAMTPWVEAATGVRFWVDLSVQDPGSDAMSLGDDGEPYREEGRIVFRPAGHGTLLENVARCDTDVLLVKNVDNIVADARRGEVIAWREALSGLLLELQDRMHLLLRKLDAGVAGAEFEAMRFLVDKLGDPEPPPGPLRPYVYDRLNRPLRVCGMVANDGQAGGGPFFIEGSAGPQIVEQAEIDFDDPEQAAIAAQATHFNPVDMALGLRDHRGVPFDLTEFVDRTRPILTRKQHHGRWVTALEMPGLWNGGMGGWNSVFVEIPRAVFQPVKTVADLLGEGHRAAGGVDC
jgi:hypothetical protein